MRRVAAAAPSSPIPTPRAKKPSLSQHHGDDFVPPGPQRHPDPDLVRAQDDHVGHDAVGPDDGEEHGERREQRQDEGGETRLGGRGAELLLHHLDAMDRLAGIDGLDLSLDRCESSRRSGVRISVQASCGAGA